MTRIGRWAFGVGRWMFSASLQLAMALHLISQPLLVAMRPHPFAALVLGNFCLSSFFKGAHSDFQTSQVAIQPLNAQYCNCVSSGNCCGTFGIIEVVIRCLAHVTLTNDA